MFRIDGPGAIGALPAPAASGAPGYFTGGDLAAGQQPTLITADFLNMLQEELMAVIAAAGLVADKANLGQVLQALRSLFASVGALDGKAPIPTPNGAIAGAFLSLIAGTNTLTLPAGGTWAFFYINNGTGQQGIKAGGETVFVGTLNNFASWIWRIA